MTSLRASGEGQTEHVFGPVAGAELVETSIGDAVVYFRVDRRLEALTTGSIRAVAAPGAEKNPFEAAADVTRQVVQLFASHLNDLGAALMPAETGIEFSFTFEAKGKATIVPVFLTGEASGQAALKVTAKWTRGPKAPAGSQEQPPEVS